jgi:Domain of unknown function (DUF4263)
MPTFSNAKDALAAIAARTQPVTAQQLSLACKINIALPDKLPCLVAAARIKRAMAKELFEEPLPPTSAQLDYLESLGVPSKRLKLAQASKDRFEMSAWIEYEELMSRAQALRALRLSEGDIVLVSIGGNSRQAEVHSLGANGKVYFKGGLGSGAWPDRLSAAFRHDDRSSAASKARSEVANEASRQTTARAWSLAREHELSEYKIRKTMTEADLEEFRSVVDSANDESTIQSFLEKRPQLLAALLTGRSRFVIPRPNLAGKYIPDFLLADVDSSGIRWVLLELETVGSGLTLQSEKSFDKYVRKGISQVEDWRRWLSENLAHARKDRAQGGRGLVDIRPDSDAIVLAGRRNLLRASSQEIRRPFEEKNRISVHTYDWLMERLQGTLDYDGLPALNPDALQR